MSEPQETIIAQHEPSSGSLRSYVSGFVLSIGLTIGAYVLVQRHSLSHQVLIGSIIGLALVQFFVQMFFFLHLGRETKPRWKLLVLGFMVLVVLILVIGSLWIMANLNYRMTHEQMNTYLLKQDGGI